MEPEFEPVLTSFEQYLGQSLENGISEFVLKLQDGCHNHFLIRPANQDGETLDFKVDAARVVCTSWKAKP